MATSILQELLGATKAAPQKEGEVAQAFLARLHKSADKVEDSGWKSLSNDTQVWCNDASKALDGGKKLPTLDGVKKTGVAAKANGKAEEEEEPVKAAKGKKGAKKASAKKGKRRAAAEEDEAPSKKKGKKAKGRPRIDPDAKLKRKVKTLPEGNRNEYWDKIPNGTPMSKIRKNKSHLRVVRYWRRNGFVELAA